MSNKDNSMLENLLEECFYKNDDNYEKMLNIFNEEQYGIKQKTSYCSSFLF